MRSPRNALIKNDQYILRVPTYRENGYIRETHSSFFYRR